MLCEGLRLSEGRGGGGDAKEKRDANENSRA